MSSGQNYMLKSMPCTTYGLPLLVVRISIFPEVSQMGCRYRVVPHQLWRFCASCERPRRSKDWISITLILSVTHICTYIHLLMYISMYIDASLRISVCVCVPVHVYNYICTCICICTYIYIYKFIYVNVYIYLYM